MPRHADPVADLFRNVLLSCLVLLVGACASTPAAPTRKSSSDSRVERRAVAYQVSLDRTLEDRILALNPERISDKDVRTTLAQGPTPRIILLHGSVYPAFLAMSS